jgi:uncharacterized phage-like protein YoqJ
VIIGITGHRAGKILGGYDFPNKTTDLIVKKLRRLYNKYSESILEPNLTIITGMATGVDQLAAQLAIDMKIPFIAAVPFLGQEAVWPAQAKQHYKYLLSQAKEIKIISEGGYSEPKMFKRNEWIVDNCDRLIAVWHKTNPHGGTFYTIKYAKSIKRNLTIVRF